MKYFVFLLIFPLLFACSSSEETETPEQLPDNFTVSGTIKDAGNTTLYVEALSQQGSIEVAKTTISPNGSFKIKGNIPGMGIYQLRLGESNDKVIPLTLVEKDHLKINTSFELFNVAPNASGTEWSTVLNQYIEKFAVFSAAQPELNAMQGKATEQEVMNRFLELKKPVDDFAREAMFKDPDNPFNIVLSTSATPTSGFENWDPANLEVLQVVAQAYKKRFKDSPIAATMENQVFQIESAYNEFLNATPTKSSPDVAPEIVMQGINGKAIKLSSLKGKVVLIDFWASWCGPCRKENPNVVRLYNLYKDKGFTVYSVSLDEDPAAWKAAIKSDGLSWPNHVSDLRGWKSPVVQQYGFDGIPHTVLIDKNGKVIGTGLRGESLEQKLKEVLSK